MNTQLSFPVALAIFIATLLTTPPAHAAVTEAWVHRYNSGNLVSNSQDVALKVARDAAGDIIVTGKSDGCDGDILTIKYSGVNGLELWQQRYAAADCEPGTGCCRACSLQPSAMVVDGSGNVVVAASIGGGSVGGYAYAAKYAATDGSLLWEKKRHDGGGYPAVTVDADGNVVLVGGVNITKYASADGVLLWEHRHTNSAARGVTIDGSGNIIVTGSSYGLQTSDYHTAKYAAATGALLWETRYNGPADSYDDAAAVAVDGSGNVVVTGTSNNTNNEQSFHNADIYTAKYAAADGALIWAKLYEGPANSSDRPSALAVDASGNVIITGGSYTDSGFRSADYYTAKYGAADGKLLWEKRYNGAENTFDRASALAVDGSGNVVVTGTSHKNEGEPLTAEYYTAKYAAEDGALLWEHRSEGYTWGCDYGAFDYSPAMTLDGNDNVVLTGSLKANYYTAKYADTNGALLWEKGYDGAPNKLSDHPSAVALDSSGNVLVTGSSYNSNGDQDYYTAKYAVANGALLWEKRYDGPARRDDRVNDMAVDGSGNVVVTGLSFGTPTSSGPYTAKYAAANGALLWERRNDGPTNSWGGAQALALDGGGNVVVTGTSYTQESEDQAAGHYTAKYAAADGALLWEKRYDGPTNHWVTATAVAVDNGGNVVVTGLFEGADVDYYDYYTAKYAAADGRLLWEKRFDGGSDYASAVAVDISGNVAVTGYSYATRDSHSDYYTAKYAAADGTLLWGKRGPVGRAGAVAVDGSGNVIVTGYSGSASFEDAKIYTAKYAAASGALLWEKRYGGTFIGDHEVHAAVAVDSMGNVVVVGSFLNGTGNNNYYTAKYAAASGALLWEMTYNGPASGEDIIRSSHSLALGPNGLVAITGSSDANFRSRKVSDYATIVYRELQTPIAPSFVGFETSGVSVFESESEASVEVKRTGNLDSAVSVQYSVTPWNGGISGQDYTDVSGILSFPAGRLSHIIRVPILNDDQPEALEGLQITLSDPSNGATLGVSTSVIRIIDNDNQSPVGPLVGTAGGQVYQDWSIQNVRWGQGYPAVSIRFDKDDALAAQLIWDNEIIRGSELNDSPEFITQYTSNLRLNALVADFGQVKMTYDLEFATQLLDLMLFDVDEEDHVLVECRRLDGTLIAPRQLQRIMEGDLSRFANAPGRPASETATPPVWDPIAGTLSGAVTWNENRSFTILRPSVPVASITLTFTGKRTGAHVYAGLWAVPRTLELTEIRRSATGESHLRWTSLPGVAYRVMRSPNLVNWVQAWSGHGAASPEVTTTATITSPEGTSPQFFKVQQW